MDNMFDRFKRKQRTAVADPIAVTPVDGEKEQRQAVDSTGEQSEKENEAQTPTSSNSVAPTEGEQQPEDLHKKLSVHEGDLDEANIVYPPMIKVLPIVTGLYLSIFLVALDQTIIATAIPKITDT